MSSKRKAAKRPGLATLALHAGQTPDPTTGARAVPIYATTSFVYPNSEFAEQVSSLKKFAFTYSRIVNPTNLVLENRLAALDGGAAGVVLASGQAAITAALLTLAHAGQNILASTSLYGGTWNLFVATFKNLGVEVRFFDPTDPAQISKLADDKTRAVYVESIGNPKNDVPDYRKIADVAHGHGIPFIVDNTVTTPALLRPIEHGADIVVYSTTKFIGGHGAHVGGAVVDSGKFDWTRDKEKWPEFNAPDPSYGNAIFTEVAENLGMKGAAFTLHLMTHWLRDTGAAQSPYATFLFLLGLETLHLRVPRHSENALTIAKWLSRHPAVDWVNYPGLPKHPSHKNVRKYLPHGAGAIVGFGIKGGRKAGAKFIDNVKLLSHLANIGDAKTLVIHPASTTHATLTPEEQIRAGVTPEYIRLSVGIEDVQDIKADIDQALKASQK